MVQRAAAAAPAHATWENVRAFSPDMQEASWLVGQPSNDRILYAEGPPAVTANVVQASYSRGYVAHAAMAPSCALAEFRNGHLSVWSHTQGVYPLRASLANVLGMKTDDITVRHAHGAGCYGHNGADDVAVDAAVIAREIPDHCIRVQWRREEEFGFEPYGPAMHDHAACGARRCGKAGGLDGRNLVRHACASSEQRRQHADARGAADAAARSATEPIRRKPRAAAARATRCRPTTFRPSASSTIWC